jgi:hypothetical protein
MRKLSVVIVATLALLLLSSTAYGSETFRFEADMKGAQEVPPVDTRTDGDITVRFNRDLTEAQFRVNVEDGVAVTMAHFHCGEVGKNGPVVAFLFGMVPGGFDVDGRLAKFTLKDANITSITPHPDCITAIGMDINSVADLAKAMRAGKIYANVHTVAHPGGEIRGQLKKD